MSAVEKGPHFLQKNPSAEFSGYGPDLAKEKLAHIATACSIEEGVTVVPHPMLSPK